MNPNTPETNARFANPPTNEEAYDFAENLELRLRESEAGAAVLREALEDFKTECRDCGGAGWYAAGETDSPEQVQCQRCDSVQAALATDAGAKLLAEVERLQIMTAEKASELLQLRAVCDELAWASRVRQESDRLCDAPFDEDTSHALTSYHSLPHVKAKGQE